MGKGNRSRQNRAEEAAQNKSAFASKPQKKQTPAWVGTLIVVLVVVLLIGCVALSVISDGGYLLRWKTVASTEHYSVNGTMLSYFFYTNYMSFMDQYANVVSYMGLETGKSLKSQTAFDNGTWFDYFMDPTLEQVKEYLTYCEEARARGIKLDDTDYDKIEANVASLSSAAAKYNYSLSAYLAAMYGTGVKEKDLRNVLELTLLASKGKDAVSDEIKSALNDSEINAHVDENKGDYYSASVLSYTFRASLDNEAAAEANKAAALAKAEVLLTKTNENDFIKYVADCVAEEKFDHLYSEASKSYEASKLPTDDELTNIGNSVKKAAVEYAVNGTEAGDYIGLYSNIFTDIQDDLIDEVASAVSSAKNTDYGYNDSEEIESARWVSSADRKAGDIAKFEGNDDNEENYTYTVFYIVSPMTKDTTHPRNVGHILFTSDVYGSTSAALAMAEQVQTMYKAGEQSKDAFEVLGNQYTEDSSVFYDDVIPGQMVKSFEDWLFDQSRKVGDTDIVKTDYGYHLMYYVGENSAEEAWHFKAVSNMTDEKISAWLTENIEKYNVDVDTNAADKVSA